MNASQLASTLRPGDEVGISNRYTGDPTITKVTRVTKTQVIITMPYGPGSMDLRFRRDDGGEIAASCSWRRRYLMTVDEAHRQIARRKVELDLHALRSKLENYDWRRVDADVANQVLALLEKAGVPAK
jgi:hypothetical protein